LATGLITSIGTIRSRPIIPSGIGVKVGGGWGLFDFSGF